MKILSVAQGVARTFGYRLRFKIAIPRGEESPTLEFLQQLMSAGQSILNTEAAIMLDRLLHKVFLYCMSTTMSLAQFGCLLLGGVEPSVNAHNDRWISHSTTLLSRCCLTGLSRSHSENALFRMPSKAGQTFALTCKTMDDDQKYILAWKFSLSVVIGKCHTWLFTKPCLNAMP